MAKLIIRAKKSTGGRTINIKTESQEKNTLVCRPSVITKAGNPNNNPIKLFIVKVEQDQMSTAKNCPARKSMRVKLPPRDYFKKKYEAFQVFL